MILNKFFIMDKLVDAIDAIDAIKTSITDQQYRDIMDVLKIMHKLINATDDDSDDDSDEVVEIPPYYNIDGLPDDMLRENYVNYMLRVVIDKNLYNTNLPIDYHLDVFYSDSDSDSDSDFDPDSNIWYQNFQIISEQLIIAQPQDYPVNFDKARDNVHALIDNIISDFDCYGEHLILKLRDDRPIFAINGKIDPEYFSFPFDIKNEILESFRNHCDSYYFINNGSPDTVLTKSEKKNDSK